MSQHEWLQHHRTDRPQNGSTHVLQDGSMHPSQVESLQDTSVHLSRHRSTHVPRGGSMHTVDERLQLPQTWLAPVIAFPQSQSISWRTDKYIDVVLHGAVQP
eukprot:23157-Chlamydomonas_euryale.AAC.2